MGRTLNWRSVPPRRWAPLLVLGVAGVSGCLMSMPAAADIARQRAALAAFSRGEYAAAASLLGAEVEDLKRTRGPRDPETLGQMVGLARAWGELGRFDDELALSEQVYRVRQEVLEPGHPDLLESMGNLAAAYQRSGRLAESLALNERLLRLTKSMYGDADANTLMAMNNYASVLSALGRVDESLVLSERGLAMAREKLGPRHPWTISAMGNLADDYEHLGRLGEALDLSRAALPLTAEVLGERHPDTILALNRLARIHRAMGQWAEALPHAERAYALSREVLGERHPATADAAMGLGIVQDVLGRHAQAIELLEQARRMNAELLGPRHPETLRSIRWLALAQMLGGRPQDAARESAAYVAGAEWQRAQPGLSDGLRQSLFEHYASGYRMFSLANAAVGETMTGLHLAELGKARTLLEKMTARQAGRPGTLPRDEQRRLDESQRRIARLEQVVARSADAQLHADLQTRRTEELRRHDALLKELKERFPAFARLSEPKIVEARELPGLVPDDAVAVNYVLDGQRIGAYVLDASGKPRYVPLGNAPSLADSVEILRLGHSDPRGLTQALAAQGKRAWRRADGGFVLLGADSVPPAQAVLVEDSSVVAGGLASLLLAPLQNELQGRRSWIVSPDGPLALLAFDALPLPWGAPGELVLDQADVHITQSLSVYSFSRALQKRYAALNGRREFLAMGHPTYSPARPGRPSVQNPLDGAPAASDGRLTDMDGQWTDLPGTEREVRRVAALFPGSSSVYLGAEASEQRLQALNASGALAGHRYLLFSTHGYFLPDQPALSGIVLSLRDRTPQADGYVTAVEWSGYDLRSDLMMLSACDTGRGRWITGEGLMGLPYGLLVAGNVNTVLTLWPVADAATAEFVARLFARLKSGTAASRALGETKREFLRERRWAHPAYWAPFVLIGAG
jgi:tetratricopeptide (TPR) repeat protein